MSASEGNQAESHGDHASDSDHDDEHAAHAGPPPPPEPHTPMWLPAVGALLFLTVGLVWALTTPPQDKTDLSGIPPESATASAAPARTAPAQPANPTQPARRAPPPGH
jgi:hypothetical protein